MKRIKFIITFAVLTAFASRAAIVQKDLYFCPACAGGCDQIAYTAPGKCPHCHMTLLLGKKTKTEQPRDNRNIKVLFYLQNGVEVLDFAGPMEVFSYAGFDVSVVSKTKDPIISQHALQIIPEYSIADAPAADILAFFGGSSGNASNDPAVIQWLKNAPVPEYYFSVCTGAFILGKAGLLDNLTVTTFHESIESLQAAVPKAKVLSHVRYVDNGKVITTAGISAGIDGALYLVEKIRGKEVAVQAARYMEYDKWIRNQGLILDKKSGTR